MGAVAGAWVGWNLTFAVLMTLALALNINVRLFAFTAAITAAITWLAAPLSHDLGQWLLDEHRLRDVVATYAGGPVGALLGWDVYTLVGGTPIALGVGLLATALLIKSAPRDSTRRRRLLAWLGDEETTTDAVNNHVTATTAVLRPYGLVMALAVLPGWIAVTAAVVPQVVCQAVVAELAHENGATVSVGHWDYRLWSGDLCAEDIRFADPARPDVDRLRIDSVTGRLGAAGVLRGELHIRQLRLAGLSTNRRRLEAAEIFAAPAPEAEQSARQPLRPETAVSGDDLPRDTVAFDMPEAFTHWDDVAEHAERYDTLCVALLKCARRGATTGGGACQRPLGGLVALSHTTDEPQRCQLDRAVAAASSERIEIVGLPESWGLGDDASVIWQCGSGGIDSNNQVARLWLTAPACASLELSSEVDLSDPAARRPLRLSLGDVSAEHVVGWQVGGVRLDASSGVVDIDAEGWLEGDRLMMTITARGQRLAMSAATPAAPRRPTGAATIHYDVLADAVAKTRRLTVDARVEGPWQRPRLIVATDRLLADMDYDLLLRSRQLAQQQPATSTGAGFRAPEPQSPAVAMRPPVGRSTTSPGKTGPARPGVVRVSPPVGSHGLRVEVARSTGVSVTRPSRIYVERPRPAAISEQVEDTTSQGADSLVAAQSTKPSPQTPPRTPLPPDWLKTGYDLSPQSTAAGRRWSAQQIEDRKRAEKVLTHRPNADAER